MSNLSCGTHVAEPSANKDWILFQELQISPKRAMLIFYNSTVGQQLHAPKYGYQIMSDTYIVNDIKAELAGRL